MSKKKNHTVDVTLRDGTVEKHEFSSKKEMRAFIRGLSIIGWRNYAFDALVKL